MRAHDRVGKIKALLESLPGGEIKYKKKMHKLVYLLQILDEDFDQDFDFHHFGVFSRSLANDLDLAEDLGLIHQSKEPGDLGYTIKLRDPSPVETIPESVSLSANIIVQAQSLAGEEPQLLEVLSTIVYLRENFYAGPELRQKLAELKPKLQDRFARAFDLAKEIYDITV